MMAIENWKTACNVLLFFLPLFYFILFFLLLLQWYINIHDDNIKGRQKKRNQFKLLCCSFYTHINIKIYIFLLVVCLPPFFCFNKYYSVLLNHFLTSYVDDLFTSQCLILYENSFETFIFSMSSPIHQQCLQKHFLAFLWNKFRNKNKKSAELSKKKIFAAFYFHPNWHVENVRKTHEKNKEPKK